MVIITCDDYEQAAGAFRYFFDILNYNDPWFIKNVFKHSLCVETDDVLRYIFVDHRYVSALEELKPDILDADEFFEDIEEYYAMPY